MELTKTNTSLAVIGCGYWGFNLVRKFHELGALVAVSDTNPENLLRATNATGVEGRNVEEILSDDTIDAVAIAVPAERHHDLVMRSFAAGKHVFVEKPIALSTRDAEKMIEASEKSGLTLMVGHLMQYHPAFMRLKKMVARGDLGKLRYIYSRRLNLGKLRVAENVLWSFAPHDVSMILALAGSEPRDVHGISSSYLQDHISDFANIHMSFQDGLRAHVETSWLNPFKEQRLVVIGDRAMAEFDDQAPWPKKLTFYRHTAAIINGSPVLEKANPEFIDVEEYEPLLNECHHFIKFIESGERPYTDGREALAVLKVLKAGDSSRPGQ